MAPPIRLPHGKRFQNEELKLLEQVIYRQERLESGEVPGHIVLYNASDIYEEADFVARRIQKLVREEGYRYREITVIARETESYRGVLDAALESYGIPYFMDQPEPLEEKPLMTLVLSALECVQSGYRSDELFRLLKTGLTSFRRRNRCAGKLRAFVESQRQAVAGAVYHASQGIFSGNDGRGSKKAGRAKPAA